ncbi:alpha/beta hydrolase [Bradyrhizobium barranii subsp. apii]|uniref:Alpha/beta hydrolase n=1 Tax=Bradyrhizobium barranii subsp. apii TaxID=2819348 RepID=A0A8T5VJP6_9BRAD|nr:alpha/beta hydrolase [Bradyrhizobium barranii]UPT89186.1 alpha/beta hydrolase [Bradyrhizobium barranii subsp. apii]
MNTKEVATKVENRVTAGLRGASWDPALLPAGLQSRVVQLATGDGAQVVGCLHSLGGESTALVIMHPRELLLTHYMVPHAVAAGYACWVQGARSVGNDIRLEHEVALHDVAAGIAFLREAGFRRIVLLGNSGGAALFAFYIAQSEAGSGDRIARTPGGRPTKLDTVELARVDGLICLAPHPGQGKLLQNMIDPSVIDESDPFSTDPALDPFSATNGFELPPRGASYATDFVERYRAAQERRVARIDARARTLIAERMAERKRINGGETGDPRRAAYSGVFQVWRTNADLRCYDLSLAPSDRRWGTVWGADPYASNLGSVGFARVCTPESWLSTWSGLSSNASFDRCGAAISQPVLMIGYSGDNTVFPGDLEAIFATIASTDKQSHSVRGNHHGQPLERDERPGQEIAAGIILDWLGEKIR